MIVCFIKDNQIFAKYKNPPQDIIPDGVEIVPLPDNLCWQCINNQVYKDGDGNWVFTENLEEKEKFWKYLREQRNQRLTACDWTQLQDVELNNKAEWLAYRQALRNLPNNTVDPTNPNWPMEPSTQ